MPGIGGMSAATDIVMPMFGQAMEFGVLVEWLAADGADVRAGQPIAAIESDKATYEMEAPAAGVLRHGASAGAEVPVGGLLGRIGGAEQAATSALQPAQSTQVQAAPAMPAPTATAPRADDRVLASPKARELARAHGIDLTRITTDRADGVIVAADVERRHMSATAAPDTIALSPLRRTAARRLAQSWSQAPHFVQMTEADASALVAAQAAIRAGELACSLNDILIRAAALTVADFPDINASYRDDALHPLPDIAVGLAVATDAGLAVPVVRNAARRSLAEVAAETRRLIDLGRHGRIGAADIGGASLTLSNLGRYGVSFGTPVLNPGEPILIFVGAIEEKAVGVDGEIVLQPRTTLSICYDHRVVDGLRAAQFSQALRQRLESLSDVLPGNMEMPADAIPADAPRFIDGQISLRLGSGELRAGAKDARLLSIAAALAVLSAELPRFGPVARKLRGVEIRIGPGMGATLICDSEKHADLMRRAIASADIASYSTAALHVDLRAPGRKA